MRFASFRPLPSVAALLGASLGVTAAGDAAAQIPGECLTTECVCPDGRRSGPVDCGTDCASWCGAGSSGSSPSSSGGGWFDPGPAPPPLTEEEKRILAEKEARRREEARRAAEEAARLERERQEQARQAYRSSVARREALEAEGGKLDAEFAALRASLARAARGSVRFTLATPDLLAVPNWSYQPKGAKNEARCIRYMSHLGLAYRSATVPLATEAGTVAPAPAADFSFLDDQAVACLGGVGFDGRRAPDRCDTLEPPAVQVPSVEPPLAHPALVPRTRETASSPAPKPPPRQPEPAPDPAKEAAEEASCQEIYALEDEVGELQRGLGQLQRSALTDAAQLDAWAADVDGAVNSSWNLLYDIVAAERLGKIQKRLSTQLRAARRQTATACKNMLDDDDPARFIPLWNAYKRALRHQTRVDLGARELLPRLKDLSSTIDFHAWTQGSPKERFDAVKGFATILQTALDDTGFRRWAKIGKKFGATLTWSIRATESVIDLATVLVSWEHIKQLDPQAENYLPLVKQLQTQLETSTGKLRDKRKTRTTACAPREKK